MMTTRLVSYLLAFFVLTSSADPIPKFLQGDWDAFVLLIEAPNEQARSLLAPGLELKAQNFTAEGTHPLLLLLSNQTNVHTTPAIVDIPQYYEFILVVPWIVRTGDLSETVYGTSIVLYLDDALAVFGGNIGWSIPKVYERVAWQNNLFEVKHFFGSKTILNFTYQMLDNEYKPYNTYSNLKTFKLLMSTEFIQPFGLYAENEFNDNSGLFECFAYNSQFEQAVFAAISGILDVNEEYVDNVPVGQFKFKSITSSSIGAFRMKTHWFLSAPLNFC